MVRSFSSERGNQNRSEVVKGESIRMYKINWESIVEELRDYLRNKQKKPFQSGKEVFDRAEEE